MPDITPGAVVKHAAYREPGRVRTVVYDWRRRPISAWVEFVAARQVRVVRRAPVPVDVVALRVAVAVGAGLPQRHLDPAEHRQAGQGGRHDGAAPRRPVMALVAQHVAGDPERRRQERQDDDAEDRRDDHPDQPAGLIPNCFSASA